MATIYRHAWLLAAALGSVHCSSSANSPTGDANAADAAALDASASDQMATTDDVPNPQADAAPSVQPDALVGADTVVPVGQHPTPREHRPMAIVCKPSPLPQPPPIVAIACKADADCQSDAGSFFAAHCLRGQCGFDQCLADSDCGNGVCGCSTDYYGGNAPNHPNICVPSNCHVDSDCGAGGYCTPTRGRCGTFEGYYCHRPTDHCYDDSECSGVGQNACVYAPTTGAWVCGIGSVCNG